MEQVLLAYADSSDGRILLVKTVDAGPSVRAEAALFDECAKNIDIYVTNVLSKGEEMKSHGYFSRNARPSEITAADGTCFREMHFHIHDDINLVLLELVNETNTFNKKGFGQIGPIISVVKHIDLEKNFIKRFFNLRCYRITFKMARKSSG